MNSGSAQLLKSTILKMVSLQRTFFFIVTLATMTKTESATTTITITTPLPPTALSTTLSPATKSREISPPCSEGWIFSSKTKSCYFIPRTKEEKDKKNWNDAKTICSKMEIDGSGSGSGSGSGNGSGNGSDSTPKITPRLVDITSAEEQKFLEEIISKYGFKYVQYRVINWQKLLSFYF